MYLNEFDFDDFFSNKRSMLCNEHFAQVGTSAVSIITSNQSVTTLTLACPNNDGDMTPGIGGHSSTSERLIKMMFPNEDVDYKVILEKLIRVLYSNRAEYSMCIIYLPDTITLEQLSVLQMLSESIENSLKDKYWNLEIFTSYRDQDGIERRLKDYNNFKNTIEVAIKRVSDTVEIPWKEKIIVNNVKKRARTIEKGNN